MNKLDREMWEYRETVLQKTQKDIYENSYKTAAYEEIYALLKSQLKSKITEQNSLLKQLVKKEEIIRLIYLEVIDSEHSFPNMEHINSCMDRFVH